MKLLVVGLGNPGKEYTNTRHNVGFVAVDVLAKELGLVFANHNKSESLVAENSQIILAKPQTFMNNSGRAVKRLVDYFNIEPKNLLVVYDDVDLEVGIVRLKDSGSSAGQKGMQSILDSLQTQEVPRVRIGIGRNDQLDTGDYVLSKFSASEKDTVEEAIQKVVGLVKIRLV